MQIQLLSNQVTTQTNKSGKSMQVLEVAYKNLTFQGKVESKKLFDFGVQAGSFKTLAVGQTGQHYEVTVVKNDAGYNDWTQVQKTDSQSGGAGASPSAGATQVGARSVSGTAPQKSTYETPEERAKKQIYIVRQSSLSNAIDLLSVGAKSQPKVDHVIETARAFEEFVFGNGSVATVVAQDVSGAGSITEISEDIPY